MSNIVIGEIVDEQALELYKRITRYFQNSRPVFSREGTPFGRRHYCTYTVPRFYSQMSREEYESYVVDFFSQRTHAQVCSRYWYNGKLIIKAVFM